jgi:hypothetical protein
MLMCSRTYEYQKGEGEKVKEIQKFAKKPLLVLAQLSESKRVECVGGVEEYGQVSIAGRARGGGGEDGR